MLGLGAYTVSEAARLIGTTNASLRRWVLGYQRKTDETVRAYPPLWPLQYELEETPILGFRDLIEARVVTALRREGLSLQSIRQCLENAGEIIHDDHPFSSTRFRTDGETIWLESTQDSDEPRLIDLKRRQHVFHRVVAPSFKDLEFGDEAAVRWWPLAKKKTLVIDPQRNFGQPIVAESGTSTARIAEAFETEGESEARVAKLYEITPQAVHDALTFERWLNNQERSAAAAA